MNTGPRKPELWWRIGADAPPRCGHGICKQARA